MGVVAIDLTSRTTAEWGGATTPPRNALLVESDVQKPPAFQFYVKDYLSSPAVRTMSLAGLGAYIRLLATSWDNEPIATLPDDQTKLRLLAGASKKEWKMIRQEVMDNFQKNDEGQWFNKRLMEQWESLKSFRIKQQENGRLGGRPKGLGYSGLTQNEAKITSASASASATAMPSENGVGAALSEVERARIRAHDIQVETQKTHQLKLEAEILGRTERLSGRHDAQVGANPINATLPKLTKSDWDQWDAIMAERKAKKAK